MASLWLVIVATALLGVGDASANCSFRHTSSPSVQPIILADNAHTDVRRIVKSDSNGNVEVASGEYVTLVCPGTYNYISGGNVYPQQLVRASCVSGTSFIADGRTININQVGCYSQPAAEVRVKTQGTCGLSTIIIEVGYNIPETSAFFLKLYEVCYDPLKLTPVNARHLVVSGLRRSASTTYSAYLLPIEPALDYVRTIQTESFTMQLDAESAKKYITTTHYLEAKQIVPAADFVFSPMELSTYFYFNTAPLWRTFTSSHWSSVESSIRELAYTQGDLDVYTGIVGIATLPNSSGTQVSMFLHAKTNELYLPLPAFLSKIVINSKNQQVIFLQMQHVEGVTRSLATERVCAEDVCAQLRWLPWGQVAPAERPLITCCRTDDPLLRSRLPRAVAAASAPSAGLLTGE